MSRISVRRVTLTLAVVSGLFTVVGLVTQIMSVGPGLFGHSLSDSWAHVFDLDAEGTLPAWFQSAMLLGCAAQMWLIRSSRAPDDGFRRHWMSLAWVFVYISADESAALHEMFGFWISALFAGSMGVYAWLIPGIAFVIILGFASWKFLNQLPPATRTGMVLAVAVYLMGAVGMELVEARMDSLWGTLRFSLLVVIEETLEMAGLVILIHTLLSHLKGLPESPALDIEP